VSKEKPLNVVNPEKFSLAVIGLGNIGMAYDQNEPDDGRVMTHSKAAHLHPRFELVAGVDLNADRRSLFSKRYRTPSFESIEDMMMEVSPDVVAIGVPAKFHYQAFNTVLNILPRAIICEKPLAVDLGQATEMVVAAKEAGVSLLVNYIRRFDPGVALVRSKLENGEWGIPRTGVVWYDKGFGENGIHFLDLLSYLLGPPQGGHAVAQKGNWGDGDPVIDAEFTFSDIRINFIGTGNADSDTPGFMLVTDQGVVRYENLGHRISYTKYGRNGEESKEEKVKSGLARYQWHVLESLSAHLCNGEDLPSDGDSALYTQTITTTVLGEG
jgi:predicted dehydrogenase